MTRFDFERAVLGASGPPSATTRFLLLVLATHVKRSNSLKCWPSVTAIEKAALLSRATIVTHLKLAAHTGWLKKEIGCAGKMRRPGNIYELRVPRFALNAPAKCRETMSVGELVQRSATMPAAEPVERTGLCQPDAETMPTEVPPLCQLAASEVKQELKKEERGDINRSRNPRTKSPSAIDAWAASTGIVRGADETEKHYALRVTKGFLDYQRRELS